MRLDEVLERLYDAEINCSVSSFWDGGWDVKLGDAENGYEAEVCVDTLEKAADWLWEAARKYDPQHDFLVWVEEGCDMAVGTDHLDRLAVGCGRLAAWLKFQVEARRTKRSCSA